MLEQLRQPEWASGLAGLREIDVVADDRDEEVMITLQIEAGGTVGEQFAQSLLEKIPGAVCVALALGGAGAGRSRDRGRDARATANRTRVLGKTALRYSVGGIQLSRQSRVHSSRSRAFSHPHSSNR